MERGVYLTVVIFLFLIFFSTSVLGATQTISVVDRSQEQQQESLSLWQSIKAYWWVPVIILILLIGVVWFIWWLVGKIKEGDDVWYRIYKDKKHLCKVHKERFRIRKFFKYHANCPIRVYFKNSDKIRSSVVGYYRGHYLSHDGNMCILFNCQRKWLVFPKPDILFLNTKSLVRIARQVERKVGREKKLVRVEQDYKFPHSFYDFRPDEISVYCDGIDKDYRTGFYFPVLRDSQGNVINMALPLYESVKQVAIEGYLFDQADDFVKVAKKSIDLNPNIRGQNKVSDASSSIETNQYRQVG